MIRILLLPLILTATLALAAHPVAAHDHHAQPPATRAPLFEGLGDTHYPITTSSELAQRYFDQGLVLAYGFNHAEAERSFRQAAELDPECALCFWGAALVLGPNVNAAMEPDAVPKAWEALGKAREKAPRASEREQALIAALAARYVAEPVDDRSTLDQAYAEAMAEVARRYPDDLHVATLYAEALMDTTPWDYWLDGKTPKPVTATILATLERVLERDPRHPGANHLYIHAVEASDHPERGVAAADRLGKVAPAAGHLVHMPSHIFLRVGRYEDAARANVEADQADLDYIAQCHAQGAYPLAYHSHNLHFLTFARALQGRAEEALDAARRVQAKAAGDALRMPGMETMQFYWATPLFTLVRFGRWEEILAEPSPAEDLVLPLAIWRYARGMALVRTGKLDAAAAELGELEKLAERPLLEVLKIWGLNPFAALAKIAREVLAGELAAARGDLPGAIARLTRGVELEDQLVYDEPPDWHAAVRLNLGAVLLAAGQPERAEAVYREDLARHPGNGWALFGLWRSLEAQGETAAAAAARADFEKAWEGATVKLASSRL